MVKAAPLTAVSASISTPVCPRVSTMASMPIPSSSMANAIFTLVSISGWHIGISSGVFLAAMMAATCATASTSPLAARPSRIRATVSGCIRTNPVATARREVISFPPTSTMWARPDSSKWVSLSDTACFLPDQSELLMQIGNRTLCGHETAVVVGPSLVIELDLGADRAFVSRAIDLNQERGHIDLAIARRREVEDSLSADFVLKVEMHELRQRVVDVRNWIGAGVVDDVARVVVEAEHPGTIDTRQDVDTDL